MRMRSALVLCCCFFAAQAFAQDLSGFQFHGFVTQGFLFSTHNNYLTMQSSSGSLQWTDGAVSISDSVSDSLRIGIQLHMYQLGQLGGPNIQIDWASGDYQVNDHLGFRAGKVKTIVGLFNDSQDIDSVFLWALLPQGCYPADNEGFYLSHLGGDVYGHLPLGKRRGSLRYVGYLGEDYLPLDGGYVKQLADMGLQLTNEPSGKNFGGDLRWETPLTGLTLGYSPMVMTLDGASASGSLHVPSFLMTAQYAQFAKGKFSFAFEYDKVPLNEFVTVASQTAAFPVDARSWYGMGQYHLTRKIEAGSYYSHYINKAMDTSLPENYSKDWVISGRYDFNAYFYAKLEDHFLHGTGLGYYASTNPNGLKPNSNILAAKIGFSF